MVQIEPYSHGTSALHALLGGHHSSLSYARGDHLYTPDQPARTLFVLTRGHVRLQLVSPEGRALTMRVVEPGQICGHMALTGDERYDTFAEAVSPVEVRVIRRKELWAAMEKNADLSVLLIDELARHVQAVSLRLDEVAFKSVPSRLASLLVAMARDVHPTPPISVPRRTHQQLADMINAQRETVTKTINEFRALRLLEIDRTAITLLNLERLRELASR